LDVKVSFNVQVVSFNVHARLFRGVHV
jgi:hypothetical protein